MALSVGTQSFTVLQCIENAYANSFECLLALAEAKLVQESKNKLSMLEHVIGVNVLDGVLGCVNVRVAVLEHRFEDERSRVSVPRSRAVVRARVAANTVDPFNICVLQAHQSSLLETSVNRLTLSMTRPMYSFSSGLVLSVMRPKLSGLPASSVAFV